MAQMHGIAPLRDEKGNLLTANSDNADLFNIHLCNVFINHNDTTDHNKLPELIPYML